MIGRHINPILEQQQILNGLEALNQGIDQHFKIQSRCPWDIITKKYNDGDLYSSMIFEGRCCIPYPLYKK
jgi:hypothetical protein